MTFEVYKKKCRHLKKCINYMSVDCFLPQSSLIYTTSNHAIKQCLNFFECHKHIKFINHEALMVNSTNPFRMLHKSSEGSNHSVRTVCYKRPYWKLSTGDHWSVYKSSKIKHKPTFADPWVTLYFILLCIMIDGKSVSMSYSREILECTGRGW